MENMTFIIKRFFYGFLSGCIINFHVIIYYSALGKAINFPSFLDPKDIITLIKLNPPFVFIISAIFVGIIVEGIFQASIEKIFELINKKKNENKIICFIFERSTILWAMKHYFKRNDTNPKKTFNGKLGIKSDKVYSYPVEDYDALQICAKVIERENKINSIFYYRDYSYVLQMLSVAFFV
jgi:hypothetical protein